MSRKTKPVPGSRGERVQQVKEAVEENEGAELTVEAFAAKLNAVARAYGFEERWSGPRFSKMVHGQEPALEDAAALVAIDPAERGWEWFVFGEKRGRGAKSVHPSSVRPVPKREEGKRAAGSK